MSDSLDRPVRPLTRRNARHVSVLCVATFVLSLFGAAECAVGQELAPFPSLDAGSIVDEIIVRSRSLERLQIEVFQAEPKFYDAFNAANTNHEFDIYCELRAPTGSHIQQRVCRANFVAKLEAQAAEAFMRGDPPPPTYAMMKAKEPLLYEDIRTVAQEHPEVLDALMKVATARQSFDTEKARRCEDRVLFCRRD
jgi:hypothetical protein